MINGVYSVQEENKMLSFSKNVNDINKQTLAVRYEESESEDEDNSSTKQSPHVSKQLRKIKERREKALSFARSIRKPKANSAIYDAMPDERFIEYDNNQYLLENQKIKMLF